jgi:hypothetical protein
MAFPAEQGTSEVSGQDVIEKKPLVDCYINLKSKIETVTASVPRNSLMMLCKKSMKISLNE